MKIKKRKYHKKEKQIYKRVTVKERYEAYKHYFPYMPENDLKKALKIRSFELVVLFLHWPIAKRLSTDQLIFKDYISGIPCSELALQHKLSLYRINQIVLQERSKLVTDIMKGVSKGLFVYRVYKRPWEIRSWLEWNKFKGKVFNTKKAFDFSI